MTLNGGLCGTTCRQTVEPELAISHANQLRPEPAHTRYVLSSARLASSRFGGNIRVCTVSPHGSRSDYFCEHAPKSCRAGAGTGDATLPDGQSAELCMFLRTLNRTLSETWTATWSVSPGDGARLQPPKQ